MPSETTYAAVAFSFSQAGIELWSASTPDQNESMLGLDVPLNVIAAEEIMPSGNVLTTTLIMLAKTPVPPPLSAQDRIWPHEVMGS